MRFLFVDRIHRLDVGDVDGAMFFREDEPFQYQASAGQRFIASGVIAEAIGQLVSWLSLARNDFAVRPIFLFADRINAIEPVPPGTQVDLHGHIKSMDNGVLSFSGSASVAGHIVQTISDCYGYFVPLAYLEDPAGARRRFHELLKGETQLVDDDRSAFRFDLLVERVVELTPNEAIMTTKNFNADEPFFKDHFPRHAITPIVVLNEMIVTATERMLGMQGEASLRPHLRAIHGIKIRQCVKPGSHCIGVVKAGGAAAGSHELRTSAEILLDGRCIMRGQYEYDV